MKLSGWLHGSIIGSMYTDTVTGGMLRSGVYVQFGRRVFGLQVR